MGGFDNGRCPAQSGDTTAHELYDKYVSFVRSYPDVLDRLVSIWNVFDLEALKQFIGRLDLDAPYEAPVLSHKRYVENREAIRRLVRAKGAHSDADRGYLRGDFVRGVYSAAAVAYDSVWDSVWSYENRQQIVKALALAPGQRLLEIGIGTGNNVRHFPQNCEATGIDFSRPMLEHCRAKLREMGRGDVRLLEMDAHRLEFSDASFDKVLCFYTLCVVEDPFQVLSEVARVLAPGGRLVIYDVVRSDIPEVVLLQYLYRPIARELGAIYLQLCPPGNITYDSWFDVWGPTEAAGVEVADVTYFDPFRTVLLAFYQKPL